uniref:Uncharacterized protein n=1 Tax=Pyxicephalus adspersus TaxID=30357 RepID=A0AAV3AI99_PYXAD|nr:TPA: hypothetical protein GDO54_013814 [Pyxicephalus adspersus]
MRLDVTTIFLCMVLITRFYGDPKKDKYCQTDMNRKLSWCMKCNILLFVNDLLRITPLLKYIIVNFHTLHHHHSLPFHYSRTCISLNIIL